ncbi:cytochrome P450 6B1-like [Ceratina calcarata]|uniref:Cytochrome P450 6B1-like n=1 Tax=Ceratina calcarata TaxID=156304 RepID=A0AAJ7N6C6_9HYME|nr:cytochrome P450 6B1-like [Ceratina calcarata]
MAMIEAFCLISAILLLLYYYSASKLSYWRRLGVKGPKPLLFVGNYKDVFLGRIKTTDCITKAYHDFKDEQMVGIYNGHIPHLILRDLDLIKDVLIKDFTKFADRTIDATREVEPLSEEMFRLEPERWRPLRTKFSPLFTTGKLKEMFGKMTKCADQLDAFLEKESSRNESLEFRQLAARYTADTVGSCVFGVQVNALTQDYSEFHRMGIRALKTSFKMYLMDRLRDYPLLFKTFGPFLADDTTTEFFVRITTEGMKYRMENQNLSPDFVDVLTKIKLDPKGHGLAEVDDIFLAAQSFVFFLAGFENGSLTIAHALYELALFPEVQEKARAKIKEVLAKTNGEITYEGLKEMNYMYGVFAETLRKYPVIMWVSRTALTDYTFRGTKVTIPKGQQVFIPISTIQRDPDIYPNPDVFDPERFTDDKEKTRHPMTFIPFGDGPRNCIGLRFARNQILVALIKILSKYKIEVCEKTRLKYKIDPIHLFLCQPYDGIHLKVTKLEA